MFLSEGGESVVVLLILLKGLYSALRNIAAAFKRKTLSGQQASLSHLLCMTASSVEIASIWDFL